MGVPETHGYPTDHGGLGIMTGVPQSVDSNLVSLHLSLGHYGDSNHPQELGGYHSDIPLTLP